MEVVVVLCCNSSSSIVVVVVVIVAVENCGSISNSSISYSSSCSISGR